MRRVAFLAIAVLALSTVAAACTSAPGGYRGYLATREARRSILEGELVTPDNGYSLRRLQHYATGTHGDWENLPVYNPAAEPFGVSRNTPRALRIDDAARAGDARALRAIGEEAFYRYPLQLSAPAEKLVTDEASARRFGFWSDARRGLGGLVRLETVDGRTHLAYSCATCHVGVRDGHLVAGVANERLDLGALDVSAFTFENADALLHWGPGRVDVTTRDGREPVRIPDLRPVRELSHLHHTASVAQPDVAALAVRLETLIITSNGETTRPPHEVALGLALYVWSLDDSLPSRLPETEAEKNGAKLFTAHCASCHRPPSYSGPPVAMSAVGTDPMLGLSLERGTGHYRVPSLRGVGTRGLLLHDGSLHDLGALLDRARTRSDYTLGRGGDPVMGHEYGLDLGDDDRAALIAFLLTL